MIGPALATATDRRSTTPTVSATGRIGRAPARPDLARRAGHPRSGRPRGAGRLRCRHARGRAQDAAYPCDGLHLNRSRP
jgi:hypothetical protein